MTPHLSDAPYARISDVTEWARKASDWLKEIGERSVRASGEFKLALSGGATPEPVYKRFKAWPVSLRDRTYIFWVDERAVATDHPDSNYGRYVPILEGLFRSIHPIPAADFSEQRDLFNERIKAALRADQHDKVKFDAVVLGMGEDGHTASLFSPPHAYAEVAGGPYISTDVHGGRPRVSLRYEELRNATYRLFLIQGKRKHDLFHMLRCSTGSQRPVWHMYPAQSTDLWLLQCDEQCI